jgi:hypothetical protein
MKSLVYLSILLIAIISSCKKGGELPQEQPDEKLFTNDSILIKDLTTYNNNAPVRGKYHLLGYGYDVAGEYADSASARKPVVDIEKYINSSSSSVVYGRSTSTGADVFTPGNAAELSRQISSKVTESRHFGLQEQEYKRYFKGEITNYFTEKNALSSRFIYGRYSYKIQHKNVKMIGYNLHKYVLPAFEEDVQTSTPEEIIKKYGTHILTNINLGAKLTVSYQAETVLSDSEKAARLGLTVSMAKVFGLFTGYLDYAGTQSATGNSSQKVCFKVLGADVSKLISTVNPNTGFPFVDITSWHQSSTEQKSELIDILEIEPIYEAIADPVKKAEIKMCVLQYLSDNEVVNVP